MEKIGRFINFWKIFIGQGKKVYMPMYKERGKENWGGKTRVEGKGESREVLTGARGALH